MPNASIKPQTVVLDLESIQPESSTPTTEQQAIFEEIGQYAIPTAYRLDESSIEIGDESIVLIDHQWMAEAAYSAGVDRLTVRLVSAEYAERIAAALSNDNITSKLQAEDSLSVQPENFKDFSVFAESEFGQDCINGDDRWTVSTITPDENYLMEIEHLKTTREPEVDNYVLAFYDLAGQVSPEYREIKAVGTEKELCKWISQNVGNFNLTNKPLSVPINYTITPQTESTQQLVQNRSMGGR